MNDFTSGLLKTAFNKCFGLQSCLNSVRTQHDAVIALSEKTGQQISKSYADLYDLLKNIKSEFPDYTSDA